MKRIKILLFGLVAALALGCNQEKKLDGDLILKESINKHDPQNIWDSVQLNIHIQEPRLLNPQRYSLLKLDNLNNTFELSRNRDQHISRHIIDDKGNGIVLLDGSEVIDSVLVKKYRLYPERNFGYKEFFYLMYGLPMSLNKNTIEKTERTSSVSFNGEDCFKIEMVLKKEMISKYWTVFISKKDFMVQGVEIVFPKEPEKGERLYFDQLFEVNGLLIPRIRHWHELKDDSYSGSDIIVNSLIE